MPQKVERTAVLILLLTSAFWLPSIPDGWKDTLRSRWSDLVHPVYQTVHWVEQGMGRLASVTVGWFTLEEENKLLRFHLAALMAHEGIHQQLLRENAQLRELLRLRERMAWKTMPAEVIGRYRDPWSQGLWIDRGKRDGIRSGMAVMGGAGLVGRIGEVGYATSRVISLTDSRFRVAAQLGETGWFGLWVGTGRDECQLRYLPLDAKVEVGQWVLTAGGNSFAPKGIPLGRVERVWIDSSGLNQVAEVRPVHNPTQLETVLIVVEGNPWHSDLE
jgi:rod shape-determining protein MreC